MNSRQRARLLSAIGALVVIVSVVPAALVIASSVRFHSPNPLSGVRSPWHWDVGGMLDGIRSPLSDDKVIDLIVRTSLIVVWVSILLIAVATALEIIHLVRHHGISMPAVRGLGWPQRVARFIAAGLLVAIPLASPKASLASLQTPSGNMAVSPTAPTTVALDLLGDDVLDIGHDRAALPTEARSSPTATRAPRIHVVQRGESVYGIAETLAAGTSLSTTDAANAILDANLGTEMTGGQRFTNPAYIEVGWELVIPAAVLPRTAAVPSTTVATGHADASSTGADAEVEAGEVHVVEVGDTLSAIADEHFGDAGQWPLLWEENAADDMGDGRSFEDPNLILPGWEIVVPASAPLNDAETDAEIEAPNEVDETGSEPEVDNPISTGTTPVEPIAEPPSSPPAPSTPVPAPSSTPAPAPSASPPAPSTTHPPVTTTTTTTDPALADTTMGDADASPGTSPAAPSPLRIEHAALLAAGILTLVGVRRRQRLRRAMPRARVPEPPPDVVATERGLRTIDSGERATRVDVAIRAAARSLVDTAAQIGFLSVGMDGDIELHLTTPAVLPAPWTQLVSAASWRLDASVPVEMLSDEARRVGMPCVALIQLGVADGRDVLIDLEACGTLAIEARADQADEVVTAIAAGLASSPYAEVAHLLAVSLPTDAFLGHRNAQWAESVHAAFDTATSLAGSTLTNDRTSFSLRSLRTGGEMWEPAVVLLTSDDQHDLAAVESSLPPSGHGLVVVASVEPDSLGAAPVRLVAGVDGWTLVAFGSSTVMTPIGVSEPELRRLANVLADAGAPLVVDDSETLAGMASESATIVAAHVRATTRSDRTDDETPNDDDTFVPMDHEIIVRLMGSVDVVSREGEVGRFERSKTVELIAWLATHREKSTRSAARTALWELDVRDATFANVVSEARRALGRLVPPVDDEEWLARTLTEKLPLHPSVVTDAQLISERLSSARLQPPAQALRTLRPAAELIRDVPFAATSYLWPDAEGTMSNLVLLATSVTTELAAHAISLGDTHLVFWATGQGLKVLPGHEELIGLRMRAHARSGDLAGVRQEWESYERVIVADAWSDGEPAPQLLALRRELLTSPT